ncbi:MAG: KH domain-containing protein [Polyangiaceae bacterium]|jgi:hypothetical protein|nr:KH domain-containing protein [Polyangiaceae bacterium]
MSLKSLIATIAKSLVEHPHEVGVREVNGPHHTVIELRVARDDIGKVIGRDGRTAHSMRALLTAAAAKLGCRSHLDIVD